MSTAAGYRAARVAFTRCSEALNTVAGSFTCDEADLLVDAMLALGLDPEATTFADCHAQEDEDGDRHWESS